MAETNDVAACEPVKEKAMSLYALAAETESVAEDLRAGYLRANVQMVMNDCQVRPKLVAPCVLKAASATEVEANCLLALDDAGDVEGRAFAGPSTGESTPAR